MPSIVVDSIIGGGSVIVLVIILEAVRELFQPCRHQRLRFPMHQQQQCLDCLRVRPYKFGEKPGPWRRDKA